MRAERQPDQRMEVDVGGHRVAAHVFGAGADALLRLNGGPGLPCDDSCAFHAASADPGFKVAAFDAAPLSVLDRHRAAP